MTIEEAIQEIPDLNEFKEAFCTLCTANDWYCPSDCDVLEKAQQLGYERIIKAYARHGGDMYHVHQYILRAKL